MKDHRLIDERSLAFDRLIVEKLHACPARLEIARENLERWMKTCSPNVRPAFVEWQQILEGPFDAMLAFLQDTGERATRLRQSSPFCGILSTQERVSIIREFYDRESSAA